MSHVFSNFKLQMQSITVNMSQIKQNSVFEKQCRNIMYADNTCNAYNTCETYKNNFLNTEQSFFHQSRRSTDISVICRLDTTAHKVYTRCSAHICIHVNISFHTLRPVYVHNVAIICTYREGSDSSGWADVPAMGTTL